MTNTSWTHHKPHLSNQRTPTPNDWLARKSLQGPPLTNRELGIQPFAWVITAAVLLALLAWEAWG